MFFDSIVFVSFFLPVIIFIYFLADPKIRNLVILIASVTFFAWNQAYYLV